MADVDPLAQLKDIHLPEPISWWPLAPGWYVLLALILIAITCLAYRLYKRHRYALAKKRALVLLNSYQKDYEKEPNAPVTSARISELLRRVALVYYPREQVASLHGETWLCFLNQTSSGIDFNSVRELLLEAPFKTEEHMNITPLFHSAKLWIQQRSVPCSK
jgi:hypothetical protein